MPPTSAAPAEKSSSGWAFNLRTSKVRHTDRDLDDSGSDSDSSSDSGVDESRMLDDLDISTRKETVVYKPNPFSIAKINAAARSTNRPSSKNEPSRPIKPMNARRKTNGSIVDGLKKQSEKAKSKFRRSSPQANATPSTVRPSSRDSVHEHVNTPVILPKSSTKPQVHPDDTHIYSDMAPGAPSASKTTSFPTGPPVSPNALPSSLRPSHIQAVETHITRDRPFNSHALSLPGASPTDAVVHVPFLVDQDSPDAQVRAPESIYARPQPPRAFQTQRPIASYFSSPVSRPDISFSPTNNASLSSPLPIVARPIRSIARPQPQPFFAPRRNILQRTLVNTAPHFSVHASPKLRLSRPLAPAVPQPFRPPTPVPIRLLPTPASPLLCINEGPRRPDPEGTSPPHFAWNPPAISGPYANPQPKAPVSNKYARIQPQKATHLTITPEVNCQTECIQVVYRS
ncbi:uncharacterized protein EV420DRAFT_1636228 [Desarmillaria tabescens]|uniref:Uncharacterized protein n=1 Tax=Armillaria tabescens TaxID=1929756 RepID=A0AA39NKB6_ARMTA|nr:uncharacterized protein EV420DRAFT_1636228 [Desarmillaria tabescens]KAK0467200.1 hypothetical protein EV420DRAFT_1636228 [Desarmillaria tabescens]